MANYTTKDIRNIALTGSQGAGKTTLVEAMLNVSGEIGHVGTIEEGKRLFASIIKTDDSFLQDVISYHIGVLNKTPKNSIYYKNLVLIEKAYNLIKMGKKQEAKNILITIPKTSVLATVAKLLEHYTIK